MLKFRDDLEEAIERRSRFLAEMSGRGVMRVQTAMLGDMRSRGQLGEHTVESDEAPDFGGEDTAPAPLQYLLASLGFCEQTMIAREAVSGGLELEDVHLDVKGYFNRRGGHVPGEEPTGFEQFKVTVNITSPAPTEVIAEMMKQVERKCYVVNTLKRAALIEHTLVHNGEVVATTQLGQEPLNSGQLRSDRKHEQMPDKSTR